MIRTHFTAASNRSSVLEIPLIVQTLDCATIGCKVKNLQTH